MGSAHHSLREHPIMFGFAEGVQIPVYYTNQKSEGIYTAYTPLLLVEMTGFEPTASTSRRAMSVCSRELHTTFCAFVYFSNVLWSWISHCFQIVQPYLWALCGHWWFSYPHPNQQNIHSINQVYIHQHYSPSKVGHIPTAVILTKARHKFIS